MPMPQLYANIFLRIRTYSKRVNAGSLGMVKRLIFGWYLMEESPLLDKISPDLKSQITDTIKVNISLIIRKLG